MTRFLLCCLLAFASFFITETSLAQTDPASAPIELEAVIIRAPADIPPHERSASSVNVITKEEIPDRAATIDEVLDHQIGIDVRSTGGVGASSELTIRGSTAQQVEIYVDGVPVSAGGSGISGLNAVPITQVEKIEVYRGSSPGTFGSGAIGGVVNISTIPPDDAFSATVSGSYGSFNTHHESLITQFGIGKQNKFALSAGHHASDNDFEYYDDRGTTIDTSDDGWESRENSDFESTDVMGSWQFDLSDAHRVFTKLSYTEMERGVPGLGKRPHLHSRLSRDHFLCQTRYDYNRWFNVQAWLAKQDQEFYDPEDEAGRKGRQDTHSDIDMWGITSNVEKIWGPVIGHLQLEFKNEEFLSTDAYYDTSLALPSERNYWACGLETEIMIWEEKMWLQPRIHFAHVEDELQDASLIHASVDSDGTLNVDRDLLTYALGWRYQIIPTLTSRLTLGSYTRLPEFDELFGDTGDVVGNPQLEEERSSNLDIGFHYSPEGLDMDIDLGYFYRSSKNLIQRRSYGDYLIAENIGKSEINGLEFWISGHVFSDHLFYRFSLAYQQALNKSDETVFRKTRYYNKMLPYHPEWQADACVRYKITDRISAAWKMAYESESYKGPSNLEDEKIESRAIHDLELSFKLWKNTELRVEASNLGDEQASDRWGYPKPGRAFYATLKWNYGTD